MRHYPRPFFVTSRSVWRVQINGKQVNLGPDKDRAFHAYHSLMASPSDPPPVVRSGLVVGVVDAFLDYVLHNRAPDTYRWYKDPLQRFCNHIPPGLTSAQLKPFHVQQWVDSYPSLAPGTKRNFIRTIKTAMTWAVEQGHIDRSPIASLRKPPAGKRDQVVSTDEFNRILEHTRDPQFRDLLTVVWETGCRPQEAWCVEARHVDLADSRWVFPASESKSDKSPRVVFLTERVLNITKRLMAEHPAGPLFRNTEGAAWTADACNCRFTTLKRKTGVRYCLYNLRHSWINHRLASNVDSLTVAVLAGHRDPTMLAKHYQHLSQNPAYLLEQARRPST